MILNNLMILAVFPIIIDLHLNLNMVQNEVFYFLCSVQAPLGIREVFWLFAIMQSGSESGGQMGSLQPH